MFEKILWRKARQPTPIFLPGESNGQRSPVGYSPQHLKTLQTRLKLFSMHTQEDIYRITIFIVTYMDKGIKITFFLDKVFFLTFGPTEPI